MKKIFLLLCIISLISCKNELPLILQQENKTTPTIKETEILQQVNCSFTINGIVPEQYTEILENTEENKANTASRTIVPTVELNTLYTEITFTHTDGTQTTKTLTNASAFEVSLKRGEYTISANVFTAQNGTQIFCEADTTKKYTVEGSTSTIEIALVPYVDEAENGTGSVSIFLMGLTGTSQFQYYKYEISKISSSPLNAARTGSSSASGTDSGEIIKSDDFIQITNNQIQIENLKPASYNLKLNFYPNNAENTYCTYNLTETLIILAGLTSNKITGNAPYIYDGKIDLTQVTAYKDEYYIDLENGKDTNSGIYEKPMTFEAADSNNPRKIILTGSTTKENSIDISNNTAKVEFRNFKINNTLTVNVDNTTSEAPIYLDKTKTTTVSDDAKIIINYNVKPTDDTIAINVDTEDSALKTELLANNNQYFYGQYIDSATNEKTEYFVTKEGKLVATEKRMPETTEAIKALLEDTSVTEVKVYSERDFANFATAVNEDVTFAGKTITLTSDLTNVTSSIGAINGNTLVDTSNKPFKGTFDGGNHTIEYNNTNSNKALFELVYGNSGGSQNTVIKNLKVTGDSTANAGIVTALCNATIENCESSINLTVSKGFDYTEECIGGIVAKQFSDTSIKNCKNTGTITVFSGGNTRGLTIGGIVGMAAASTKYDVYIENCTNEGTIIKTNLSNSNNIYIGGVVGYLYQRVSLKECSNTGNIEGYGSIGGLVGYLENGSTIDTVSTNSGKITPSNSDVAYGNIVGTYRINYIEMYTKDLTKYKEDLDENNREKFGKLIFDLRWDIADSAFPINLVAKEVLFRINSPSDDLTSRAITASSSNDSIWINADKSLVTYYPFKGTGGSNGKTYIDINPVSALTDLTKSYIKYVGIGEHVIESVNFKNFSLSTNFIKAENTDTSSSKKASLTFKNCEISEFETSTDIISVNNYDVNFKSCTIKNNTANGTGPFYIVKKDGNSTVSAPLEGEAANTIPLTAGEEGVNTGFTAVSE